MRTSIIILLALLAVPAYSAREDKKPNIMILATGGTIAGKGEAGGHGYTSGQFNVQELIAAAPGVDKIANLKGEQVANIGSQDMNDQVWLKLADRVNQLLARDDVDGIVITHGTDTMEETAFFLNLVIKSDKPVVLTGSMRPATAVSADGPKNLYDAITVAINPKTKGRGVLVSFNEGIYDAREVMKLSTTKTNAFGSPNTGAVGQAYDGRVEYYSSSDREVNPQQPVVITADTK